MLGSALDGTYILVKRIYKDSILKDVYSSVEEILGEKPKEREGG